MWVFMEKMKKIILIGALYYDNLGDPALIETTQRLLEDKYRVEVIDIYGRGHLEKRHMYDTSLCFSNYKKINLKGNVRSLLLELGIDHVTASKKSQCQNVSKMLSNSITTEFPDAIVFAGGAIFKGVFLHPMENIMKIAEKENIPVIFNACGIDSNMFKKEWVLLGRILRSPVVRYISVRDGKKLLTSHYPDIAFNEVVDTAVCANRIYQKAERRNKVGLGIMLFKEIGFDKQVTFWTELVKELDRNKVDWEMFTNGIVDDQVFAGYLLERLGKDNSNLHARCLNADELFKTISSYQMIVSMRLHSLILAYSSATPFVAIAWDKKVNEFCCKIQKEKYCCSLNSATGEVVHHVLNILSNLDNDTIFFHDTEYLENIVERNILEVKKAVEASEMRGRHGE